MLELLSPQQDPLLVERQGGIETAAGDAVFGSADPWLVINQGTIFTTGTDGVGVDLQAGGVVLNSGTIQASGTGGVGVRIMAGATASTTVAIANFGTIGGALDGVQLTAGGSVIETGQGRIDGLGRDGILVSGGAGTVTSAGTIDGSFADRVVLDPGAVLKGVVSGGSGTNTLELAAGSIGGTGTVPSFGTEFTNSGSVLLDKARTGCRTAPHPPGRASRSPAPATCCL